MAGRFPAGKRVSVFCADGALINVDVETTKFEALPTRSVSSKQDNNFLHQVVIDDT